MEPRWEPQPDSRSYYGYGNQVPRSTTPIPHHSQVMGHPMHPDLSMYSAEPLDYFEDPRYQPELHARLQSYNVRSHSPHNLSYPNYQTMMAPQYHTQVPYGPPRRGYAQQEGGLYQPRRQSPPR